MRAAGGHNANKVVARQDVDKKQFMPNLLLDHINCTGLPNVGKNIALICQLLCQLYYQFKCFVDAAVQCLLWKTCKTRHFTATVRMTTEQIPR